MKKVKVSNITEPTSRTIDALVVVDEIRDAVIEVENVTCLPELARKVDKISASVRDLECEVVNGRIIVRGTLHKQIFYVNRNEHVVHHGEDTPFSASINVEGAEEGMTCQINDVDVDVDFNLVKASRLQMFATITLGVIKILDEEQLCLPALGSIEGELRCDCKRDEIVFAKLELFDDEGRLIDQKRLFEREIDEADDCDDNEVDFRFVSLPPGTYNLKILALCCDMDDICRRKPPMPWVSFPGGGAPSDPFCDDNHHDDHHDDHDRCTLYCEDITVEVEDCQITVLDITLDDECDRSDLRYLFKEHLVKILLFEIIRDEFKD